MTLGLRRHSIEWKLDLLLGRKPKSTMHRWGDECKGEGDACILLSHLHQVLRFPKAEAFDCSPVVALLIICSLLLQVIIARLRDEKRGEFLKHILLTEPGKLRLSCISNIDAPGLECGRITQKNTARRLKEFFHLDNEPGIGTWFRVIRNGLNVNVIIVKGTRNRSGEVHYEIPNDETFRGANHNFLFHATKREAGLDILKEIRLDEGKAKRDFSHDAGFYLNDDLDGALKFLPHIHKRVVVVFRRHQNVLAAFDHLDLSGYANHQQWQSVVNYYREGASGQKPDMLTDNLGWIEGPMARRTRDMLWVKIPNTYQLCVKSRAVAVHFDRNVHSLIFLDSPDGAQ